MIDVSFAEIAGESIVLRRFRASDARVLADYRNDPVVARYQGYEGCTLEEAEGFIEALASVSPGQPGEWFQFAVSRRGESELIGDCALRADADDPRQAELGFSFARASRGAGLASDAVRTLLGYAFTKLDLHRVYAVTDERNVPAQRLLERTDFRKEAHFVKNAWFKGEWSSELVYAYLQEDFSEG